MFKDFDWVAMRSQCSVSKVFEILKTEVQRDVDSRKKLLGNDTAYKYDVVMSGNSIVVILDLYHQTKSVRFTRGDNGITVTKDDAQSFTASLTINQEGECRLKIGNTEHDLWEVRKMALEQLFFETSII